MYFLALLSPLALLVLGCGFFPTDAPQATGPSAPVAAGGTGLATGVSTQLGASGSLEACGLTASAPTSWELVAAPKNGLLDTYALHPDSAAWAGWDARRTMDLTSFPAGSRSAEMATATAELGRTPDPASAYGVSEGYDTEGEACEVYLYTVLVEPTTDGWQVTEVGRHAILPPPVPVDGSDPDAKTACGLDRANITKVDPCGTRITRVSDVTAQTSSSPLTGSKLQGARGIARERGPWSETESLLVARLGPPTQVEGAHHIWAVRDGEACVWFDVEKGWTETVLGDASVDPTQLVGAIVEPYVALEEYPYYDECMAVTGA